MSTENKQDTITVELPIEAQGEYVRVKGFFRLTREYWRDIASKPKYSGNSAIALAPAVVAWMERDEWKPLDLPVEGRTIKATLRDGRVVEGEVRQVVDMGTWVDVLMGEDSFSIDTSPKAHPYPADITAWEYVDEAAPIKIPADGSRISATFGDGSIHVIAVKWASRVGKLAGVIQSSITQYRVGEWDDGFEDPQRDIIAWEYVDEPAVDLAALADKIAAAVNELREAIK